MAQADTDIDLDGKPLIEHLLEPTRIYVKSLLKLIEQVPVHAMAHITGGGLPENLPRVLPDNVRAVIDTKSWEFPAVFQWLQQEGQVPAFEMYRTFQLRRGHGHRCPRQPRGRRPSPCWKPKAKTPS